MCDSCGCDDHGGGAVITVPAAARAAGNTDAGHHHHHAEPEQAREGRVLKVEQDVLGRNNHIAAHNREEFAARKIVALNFVSSPGSGKTTLLEQTIGQIKNRMAVAVIEGDQQTLLDAERIDATGVPVVQVNTGAGCHLDAEMVHRALHRLELPTNALLFIENVGNLVCPAMFDLGETAKVVVISVTEGEDKPLKYPAMFAASSVCIINKIDLLPHLDFDVEACKSFARKANPDLLFFELSARSGEGMDGWINWLYATADSCRG